MKQATVKITHPDGSKSSAQLSISHVTITINDQLQMDGWPILRKRLDDLKRELEAKGCQVTITVADYDKA